ncbi:MAG TPA: GntP family permease [Chitinophagaceae bacterium]|jgi:gluconate:H+ symporter, GntP family|nr:GntP family permease [Chitinophagaceae bacterium]
MTASFAQSFSFLLVGIAVIILLTAKYRVHAVFALLIACFIVGLGVELPFALILTAIKEGFGRIMQSLGFIIVLGTTLGVLLEHSGSTRLMANYIIRQTGERRTSLAMSIAGFVVGLPVFCDSGYIVMSGLNQSLAKRTGISVVTMALSLATGLYSVHCLIPPHPGATAAAVTIGVDLGKLILIGTAVAIPGMIMGHVWSRYAGKKLPHVAATGEHIDHGPAPSVIMAFLPVIVPIILITINSFFVIEKNSNSFLQKIFSVLGEPIMALSVGILLVFGNFHKLTKPHVSKLLTESAEKAGGILVIIGAGGAFGAVLAAARIGEQFSETIDLRAMGIFFPFLLTFILKTAQGSSTVAIITASSIVLPLLPALGLDSERGRLLSVLSMGAGSMMISHANDAYFWVISKFSGLEMKTMLRTYSVATLLMGSVTLVVVYILSLLLL